MTPGEISSILDQASPALLGVFSGPPPPQPLS